MPGLFSQYGLIIMDATFFVSRFSDEIKNSLAYNDSVYVAETFVTELNHYKAIVNPQRRVYYEDNIKFVNEKLAFRVLPISKSDPLGAQYGDDTWGLVQFFNRKQGEFNQTGNHSVSGFVVITANQVLINKIILNNLPVDIYDLNNNKFKNRRSDRASSYPNVVVNFTNSFVLNPEIPTELNVLYGKSGSIILGDKLSGKNGKEAQLYYIKDNPNKIIKLFKAGELTENKYKNLKNIMEIRNSLQISWASFPEEFVYYDRTMNRPAGVVEQYVKVNADLGENLLYLGAVEKEGNDEELTKLLAEKNILDSLELCIKIVRQICYLNCFGFYVSDYNLANFATIDDLNLLQMWDTDSFGYRDIFGEMNDNDLYLIHKPDSTTRTGAFKVCDEALYAAIFKVLSLGDMPISPKYRFRYDNEKYPGRWKTIFFPPGIYSYLEGAFKSDKEMSPEALLYRLDKSRQELLKNRYDKSYSSIIGSTVGKSSPPSTTESQVKQKTTPSAADLFRASQLNNDWNRIVRDRIVHCKFPSNPKLRRFVSGIAVHNAIKACTKGLDSGEVLALLDLSPLKIGTKGIIFTRKGIYGNLKTSGDLFLLKEIVPYSDIERVEVLLDDAGDSYNLIMNIKNKGEYRICAGNAAPAIKYVLGSINK